MADHKTAIDDEGRFVRDQDEDPVKRAEELHHLATADPEPERDGVLTSQQHEEKYGLERASDLSVAVDLRREGGIETASAPRAAETAAADRASDNQQ